MVEINQAESTGSYPEIYLAIDNCFASKRYTEPLEWMQVVGDLGVNFVEASADNECDPLYQGMDYMRRWVGRVQEASAQTGVKVCNLYSGHGTYSTLGLAHTDPAVRNRMLNEWLKPMAQAAGALDAGLGFFCHAFSNAVLQNSALYKDYCHELTDNLAEIAGYAHDVGCKPIGLEQMYTPHQIPWTINGARTLIEDIVKKAGHPFYLTIDTGHQSGQRNFLKPDRSLLNRVFEQVQHGESPQIWLGSDKAYQILEAVTHQNSLHFEDSINQIVGLADEYPHLFAEECDGSVYAWLEELACYSPIIHLQQTDGRVSAHWPFTPARNKIGIIDGAKVLKAIKSSYDNPGSQLIPKVNRIYLTIEVFSSTGSINYYTMKDLEETVHYWRQFIPEDGKKLS